MAVPIMSLIASLYVRVMLATVLLALPETTVQMVWPVLLVSRGRMMEDVVVLVVLVELLGH